MMSHIKGSKVYQSLTYMWSSDDYLARGATGQVFKGYNKATGEKVAIKMFTIHSEYNAMQREMSAIKQIPKHENVVQFLETEEKEKTENIFIIVMELCNAGSLFEVIDSPENALGLDEEQFKLVILHVSRGLSHLKKHQFAHRDIKPGNILRMKTLEGKYIFKLTDFGTARKLDPEERFTSLHGTEEYLYPAMYERALINPRMRGHFQDKVDLWSVGATFFHVATGRLPFQPYLKRNDQRTMHKITTEKKSGYILGWQMEANGDIFYSEQFPPDAKISAGLKAIMTPVLAGLLENNFEKMWAFDQFFEYIEFINRLKVVDVFCVSKCTLIKVYLRIERNTDVLTEFKQAVGKQTGISPQYLELYYDNIPLRPPEPGQPFILPNTTPDTPVTVVGGPPQVAAQLETPALPATPNLPPHQQHASLTDDLRFSKDCCKVVWSYMHAAEYLTRTYRLMQQAANCLSQTVRQEYTNVTKKKDMTSELYDFALKQLESHIISLQYEDRILQCIGSNNSDVISTELEKISRELQSKQKTYDALKEAQRKNLDFEPFLTQFTQLFKSGSSHVLLESPVFDDGVKKMKHFVDEINEIFKSFQSDKKSRIGGMDGFTKRVNEIKKRDIVNGMQKAKEEVVKMVKARSDVYGHLYTLLAEYTALREGLTKADASLTYYVEDMQQRIKLLEEWVPQHHHAMQSVYQRVASSNRGGQQGVSAGSMGSGGGSVSSTTSSSGYNSNPSSMAVPPEIISLLNELQLKTDHSKQLIAKQKNIIQKNNP